MNSKLDDFKPGRNYCLLVDDQREAIAFLKRVLSTSIPCTLVTTTHPRKLQEDHGLEGVEMIWVTDEPVKGYRSIPPGRMRFELTKELMAFITKEGAGVVFIEGIEYLTLLNGFDAVMAFTKQLADKASSCGDSLVVAVSKGSMPEAQFIVFKGRFDRAGKPSEFRIPGETTHESSGPAALADQVLASVAEPPPAPAHPPAPAIAPPPSPTPAPAPPQVPSPTASPPPSAPAAGAQPAPQPPPPPAPTSGASLLEQVEKERKTRSR
jgi:hypothetical protein